MGWLWLKSYKNNRSDKTIITRRSESEGIFDDEPLFPVGMSAEDKHKSPKFIKLVQEALKNSFHSPEEFDGKIGEGTRKALRAFKRAQNLPVNDEIDDETLMELRRFFPIKSSRRQT